ncbi:MAG: mechanosensitive ion channel domain-containing protein [Pseudomonadota bacterium]
MEPLLQRLNQAGAAVADWFTSPQFYGQAAIVVGAWLLAIVVAGALRGRLKPPQKLEIPGGLGDAAPSLAKARTLLFPATLALFMGAAVEVSQSLAGQIGVARLALGLSVVYFIHAFITGFIGNRLIVRLVNLIGVPIALLHVFGWLDDVTAYLDGVSISVGNIRFSLYVLARTVIFGAILFWFGRISNSTGKRVIRSQPDLDSRTREIVAKLFEIALFVVFFLLLLQIMGISLTTLAVFGGAVGVGLGFGLQQIASNFISGIIILLDKSITIGDFIELEDGRSGRLRELSMRSATLETYDGKDIMVPNETFITSSFTNWTHYNEKQRYSLNFSVAYKTDLPALFDIVREVVASHPKVLSGDAVPAAEQPDAEIDSFGDSGVNILVEFWMEGVDDGENRVGADLLLMIWMALKQHDIEMPFPQREVAIVGGAARAGGPGDAGN